MREYTTSVDIERPPEDVFRYVADLDNVGAWLPDIQRIEVLGDGVVRAGAVFRETRVMRGREVTADITVLEHSGPDQGPPPYLHSASSKAAGVECTYRYRIEPSGGGSRVELLATAVPKSFFGKLVARAFLAMMIKADGDQLERLKAAIEQPAQAPGD